MTQVTHSKFGNGTVISITKDTVTVDFNGTVKELMKMYANLKNEDGSNFEGRETFQERVERMANNTPVDINDLRKEITTNTRKRWGI